MTNSSSAPSKTLIVSGVLFLFFIAVSIVHYSVIELNLVATTGIQNAITFIQSQATLYRFGIVIDLVLFTTIIVLCYFLYVLLRPVNKNVALLGFAFMLIETTLTTLIELSSFAALLLAGSKTTLLTNDPLTTETLLALTLRVRAEGYGISIIFFSMSFFCFYYLFLNAGYIPKALAVVGVMVCAVQPFLTFLKITFPEFPESVVQAGAGVLMVLQIATGLYLLFRGMALSKLKLSEAS